jgi:carboxyl-terminal processing protease
MNKNSLLSGVLGSLRKYATALILAASVITVGMHGAFAQNAPASNTPTVTTNTTVAAPVAAKFDGVAIYNTAFEVLRDYHKDLQNPVERAKFIKEWQNRHATDGVLNTEAGTDKAVYEMVWSLGQRFDYYNLPEANQAEKARSDASLAGIGATLYQKGLSSAIRALGKEPKNEDVMPLFKLSDERPVIVAEDPDSDTPSGKAGLKKGDRIVAVDGASVNGKTLDEVVKTIRGTPGTTVTLSIVRKSDGADQKINLPIVRAKFIVHVVKSEDLGDGVTHIKLTHFESQYGTEEMYNALSEAAKGKAIILDLRGNPGGELSQPISMAGMLMEKGIVVQLIQRSDDDKVTITHSFTPTTYNGHIVTSAGQDMTKTGKRPDLVVPKDMPVIVLVDGGSASASEILAGALQANKRALVIGQPTVGKGVGQNVIPLPGDRNLHVTSFEFRPAAQVMDWIGIVPDIEVIIPEDANLQEDPSSDAQLNRAKVEAIAAIAGKASPARPTAEIAARKAELKKKNEDNFAKEVEARRKAIAEPAEKPAADGTTVTPPADSKSDK